MSTAGMTAAAMAAALRSGELTPRRLLDDARAQLDAPRALAQRLPGDDRRPRRPAGRPRRTNARRATPTPPGRSAASPWRSRTCSASRATRPPRGRASWRTSGRRTRPRRCSGSSTPAPCPSARPTATSSPWARRPRTQRSGRRATPGTSSACPGGSSGGQRGRGGRGHRADQLRHRHRWVDPPAGLAVRRGRVQTDVRPRVALRAHRLRLVARPGGPVRAHRRGRRRRVRGRRRPRPARQHVPARRGRGPGGRHCARGSRGCASACRASTWARGSSPACARASPRRSRCSRASAHPSRRCRCRAPTSGCRRTTSSRPPSAPPTWRATTACATAGVSSGRR